jgi:hypothetical protein
MNGSGHLTDIKHIMTASILDAYYQAVDLGEAVHADSVLFGPYNETWRIEITKKIKKDLTTRFEPFTLTVYDESRN